MTLGGFKDWRLTTIQELNSMVVKGKDPAYNDAFKNVADTNDEVKGWYWSDTPCDECPEFAWAAQPVTGEIKADHNFKYNEDKTNYHVRCVRDYK